MARRGGNVGEVAEKVMRGPVADVADDATFARPNVKALMPDPALGTISGDDPRASEAVAQVIDLNALVPKQVYLAYGYVMDEQGNLKLDKAGKAVSLLHPMRFMGVGVYTEYTVLNERLQQARAAAKTPHEQERVILEYGMHIVHLLYPSLPVETLQEMHFQALAEVLGYTSHSIMNQPDELKGIWQKKVMPTETPAADGSA